LAMKGPTVPVGPVHHRGNAKNSRQIGHEENGHTARSDKRMGGWSGQMAKCQRSRREASV
jgi:hypothetical protein